MGAAISAVGKQLIPIATEAVGTAIKKGISHHQARKAVERAATVASAASEIGSKQNTGPLTYDQIALITKKLEAVVAFAGVIGLPPFQVPPVPTTSADVPAFVAQMTPIEEDIKKAIGAAVDDATSMVHRYPLWDNASKTTTFDESKLTSDEADRLHAYRSAALSVNLDASADPSVVANNAVDENVTIGLPNSGQSGAMKMTTNSKPMGHFSGTPRGALPTVQSKAKTKSIVLRNPSVLCSASYDGGTPCTHNLDLITVTVESANEFRVKASSIGFGMLETAPPTYAGGNAGVGGNPRPFADGGGLAPANLTIRPTFGPFMQLKAAGYSIVNTSATTPGGQYVPERQIVYALPGLVFGKKLLTPASNAPVGFPAYNDIPSGINSPTLNGVADLDPYDWGGNRYSLNPGCGAVTDPVTSKRPMKNIVPLFWAPPVGSTSLLDTPNNAIEINLTTWDTPSTFKRGVGVELHPGNPANNPAGFWMWVQDTNVTQGTSKQLTPGAPGWTTEHTVLVQEHVQMYVRTVVKIPALANWVGPDATLTVSGQGPWSTGGGTTANPIPPGQDPPLPDTLATQVELGYTMVESPGIHPDVYLYFTESTTQQVIVRKMPDTVWTDSSFPTNPDLGGADVEWRTAQSLPTGLWNVVMLFITGERGDPADTDDLVTVPNTWQQGAGNSDLSGLEFTIESAEVVMTPRAGQAVEASAIRRCMNFSDVDGTAVEMTSVNDLYLIPAFMDGGEGAAHAAWRKALPDGHEQQSRAAVNVHLLEEDADMTGINDFWTSVTGDKSWDLSSLEHFHPASEVGHLALPQATRADSGAMHQASQLYDIMADSTRGAAGAGFMGWDDAIKDDDFVTAVTGLRYKLGPVFNISKMADWIGWNQAVTGNLKLKADFLTADFVKSRWLVAAKDLEKVLQHSASISDSSSRSSNPYSALATNVASQVGGV